MAEPDAAGDLASLRRAAAAVGIELDGDRAERLAGALERYQSQVAKLERLDLDAYDPGVADPAAGR